MAKFVGKIFRIPDRYLKNILGNGAHFVHVTWYNPKNHKFRCKVITSLEEISSVPKSERGRHKGKTYAVYDAIIIWHFSNIGSIQTCVTVIYNLYL